MDSKSNSAACAEHEVLLEDMLHGDLSAADAARLADHLETCEGCRDAYDDATRSVRILRAASAPDGQTPQPGPAFARIVMARIRERREELGEDKSLWQPLTSFARRLAMVAALALAALIAYGAMWSAPQTAAVAAMQAADSQELFGGAAKVPATRDEVLMMVADTSHGKH